MAIAARAEQLADLSEVAAACASCFCRARCTGLDVKVIAPVARAAVRLGAEEAWLYRDEPPFPSDTAYLDGLHAIVAQLRARIAELAKLYRDAYRQAVMAQRMLRAARDESARAAALALLNEALYVMEVADNTATACWEAARLLMVAEADFRCAYELTEATVAAGHPLPYNGRWITGDEPRRQPAHAGQMEA